MGGTPERMTLRGFARAQREAYFREQFEKTRGQTVEEAYPNVPFSMVYDLHAQEFKDPMGTPVHDRWRQGKIEGQTLPTSTILVKGYADQAADGSDAEAGDIEKSEPPAV